MALKFLNNGYFAGTVGIGTESPLKKLSINGGDVAVNNGNSFIVGAAITGNTQIGELGADSGQLQLLTESARDIKFGSTTYGNIMFLEGSNGNVGIGTTSPNQKLDVVSTTNDNTIANTVKISHSRSNTDVATNALFIDMNLSGADATTADRQNRGIFVDIDSTADGDATNKHRIRGVNSDVRFSGFSDVVQSGYFYAESNNNTVKTAQLIGVYGNSVHDSSTTSGGVSNMYGVYGNSDIQDLGDVDNAFGGFFQVNIGGSRGNANIGITKGVEGQINIDKATTIDYNTMMAVSAIIDNNEGAVPNFGNQFLFRGDYQGDRGSNAYGVYCEGDKHYLEGKLAINLATPTQALHVAGNARVTGAYYDSNNSPGTANQVLVSTVTGTDWVDGSAIPGVPAGSGTLNTVTMWTPDGDTLGDGPITFSGNNSTFSGAITIGAHLILQQDGTNDLIKSTGNVLYHKANEYSFQDNSSNSWVTIKSGNVGIGTTSPSDKLDIAGAARFTSNISFSSSKPGRIYKASNHGLAMQGVTGTENDLAIFSPTGSLRIVVPTGTNNLVLNRDIGNVGIGTSSPSAKLEVTGNTRLGSGTFHVSSDATLITSATYTFRDGVYINNPNSTSAAVASGNVMSIGASSGNTVFTSLITTGAIGIGKSNPSAQLDVVGTGNFTGLVSGITPVAAANFATKAYVDGSIPSLTNYVTLNTAQTITATKTFTADVNVGAATTNGAGIHLIYSTSTPEIRIQAGEGGDNAFSIYNTATNPDAVQFFINNNLGSSHLGNARGALKLETSAGVNLTLNGSNATFAGSITFNGTLNSTGNLILSTASAGANIEMYTDGNMYYDAVSHNFRDSDASPTYFNITASQVNSFVSLAMNNYKITTLATPTNAADAATKAYVDAHGGGLGPFLPLAGNTNATAMTGDIFLAKPTTGKVFNVSQHYWFKTAIKWY